MNKLEILEKLISFNTIDDQDNFKIMNFIGDWLKEKGFIVEYIYNSSKTRKCLIAKYKNPNLLFVGHTDTVGYSNWTYDPFKLTEDDGKLHGLGSCDMKGGIAAFLKAIDEIDLKKLKEGIEIILTYDEEKNFEGIKLIQNLQNDFPDNVIIGEPTSLIPVTNTKGCMEYKVIFPGISAHSSNLNKGDNAIIKCFNFVDELNTFYSKLKEEVNTLFEIPYTTMNIAQINGGKAINIVPDNCKLLFDFRTISKSQHKVIREYLEKLVSKYNANLEEITNIYPLENNNDISFYEKITNKTRKSFNFVTEASFLNKDNIIILGVGPNNEHQKDEYIDIDSYNKLIEIYKEIIKNYCK